MHDELQRVRELDGLNWLLVVLGLVLAGIHLYLGVAAPFVTPADASKFAVIAVVFVVGAVVYLTSFWRPVLYLLATFLGLYLGQLWLLGGMQYFFVGAVTGVVSTGFLLLAFYLFYREEEFFSR